MPGEHDAFGLGSNVPGRVFRDYGLLARKVQALREFGKRIVLTSGSFELLHVGHGRYLEKAKQHGDILIVGVDSDEKVRTRKGKRRPVVPEDERIEMLCHLRYVDAVFLKQLSDPHMELIKVVRPDVLIMTQGGFREEERAEREQYCGTIVVLEPQATTSTTAKIRLVIVLHIDEIKQHLDAALEEARAKVHSVLDALMGGDS